MEKRSHDGCWTCRLRRKKCDEKDPICTPCLGLGLTCHKSSQKPSWMDGGAREKAERMRVKMAVAKAVKDRRANNRNSQSQSAPRRTLGTEHERTDHASHQFDASASGSLFQTNLAHETLVYDQPQTPQFLDNGMFDGQPFPTAILTPPESEASESSNGLHNFTATWDPSPVLPFDNNLCLEPLLPSMTMQEATLMIHYFESTVHWQFQFLHATHLTSDKAWLIWLMANSRPVYLAALALSASYMKISTKKNAMYANADTAGLYHTSAVTHLHQSLDCYQAQSPPIPRTDAILILAGITMLLSLNVLHGGDADWRFHLKAATGLLSQRLAWSQEQSLIGVLADMSSAEASSCNYMAMEGSSTAVEVTAAKWIISSIVWFDTVSILNRDCKPSLYEHYIQVLCEYDRDGSSVVSTICENWVLLSILQTQDLRIWKQKARTEGSLSVWALTKRASLIREPLEADIATTYQWLSQAENDGDEGESRYMKKITTYTFACAAAILLETVTSGGHPSLPEIQRAVSRAIAALDMFPDIDHLRTLAWPLCVTGCMAEPHHYSFFRELISSVSQSKMANLQNVLDILERCWSLRRVESARPDGITWENAMSSLGRDILLI